MKQFTKRSREVMESIGYGIVVFSMIILVNSSLLTGNKIKKMKTLTKRTVREVAGAITVNVKSSNKIK